MVCVNLEGRFLSYSEQVHDWRANLSNNSRFIWTGHFMLGVLLLFLMSEYLLQCFAQQCRFYLNRALAGMGFGFVFYWIKFTVWKVLQLYTSVPAFLALGRWMLPCLTCRLVGTKLTNPHWTSWISWSQIPVVEVFLTPGWEIQRTD